MTTENPDRHVPFDDWLRGQRGGALVDELTASLSDVVEAVRHLGKSGSVTLTIRVRDNDDGRTVIVTDDVATKIPQPARPASLYFVDEHANLRRDDPFQRRLPIADDEEESHR